MKNISTKELNYVKDFLSWELYMAKLCKQYTNQMSDQNYSRLAEQSGQIHQQNYTELFNYLESIQ
jgi:hypothetical protein